MSRRSTPLLSVSVLGATAWLLTSCLHSQTFVAPRPARRLRGGHTSLHAFEEEELLFQPGQRVTLKGPPAMAGKQGTVVGPARDEAFAIQFDTGSIFNIAIPDIEGSGVAAPPAAAAAATVSPAAPAAAATVASGDDEELLFQPGERVTLTGPPAMAGKQGTVIGPKGEDAFAIQFDTGSIFNIDVYNIAGSGVPPAASHAAPAAISSSPPASGDDEELLFQPGERVTLTGPPAMAGKQGTVIGPKGDEAFAIQFDTGSIFNIDVYNIQGSGIAAPTVAATASSPAPAAGTQATGLGAAWAATEASNDEDLEFLPGQRVKIMAPAAMIGKTGTVSGPPKGDAFPVMLESGSIFNIETANLQTA